LVKSLHPIHEIAARVSQFHGNCVRLMRRSAADAELPELAIVADVVPPADPTEATVAALAEPIEYPPLAAGIVPGDRVTIALDETTPRAGRDCTRRNQIFGTRWRGKRCDYYCRERRGAMQICREACSIEQANGMKFVVHDPNDEKNLWYGRNDEGWGAPVVNREIFRCGRRAADWMRAARWSRGV